MKSRVSVVIPNYNGEEYLEDCLESLMRQKVQRFEILVVDDASTDHAIEKAKQRFPEQRNSFPKLRYLRHKSNAGFCKSVNDGIAAAEAEYVILLNNDTRVEEDFVESLWREIRKSGDIFSVSAAMLDMKDPSRMDDAGDYFCSLGWAFAPARDKAAADYTKRCEVFSACGGAAIYSREKLLALGGFDERHFAYLEDVDIGWRAKWQGWRNLYAPAARVLHAGSASSGSRYNEFKLRHTVRNQVYLLYKNLPLWMYVFNFPQLLAGWLVKFVFFAKKGMGRAYAEAFAEGWGLCRQGKDRRVDFADIPFSRQLAMEGTLLCNTLRRFR